MAKIRAAAQAVPQSQDEADTLLGQIGALQREVERIEADLSDRVALAKAEARHQAAPIAEAIKVKFEALRAWAEAHKASLLKGGRRSVSLSQGTIGWRRGMPAVRIARGAEELVIATLRRLQLGSLLRERTELDREAIIRRRDLVEGIAGITVEQVEKLWARPLDVKVDQEATVARLTGDAIAAADEAAA